MKPTWRRRRGARPSDPTTTRQTATKTRTEERQAQIHSPQGGEDRPLAILRCMFSYSVRALWSSSRLTETSTRPR